MADVEKNPAEIHGCAVTVLDLLGARPQICETCTRNIRQVDGGRAAFSAPFDAKSTHRAPVGRQLTTSSREEETMGTTRINRTDLGAGAGRLLEKKDFTSLVLDDVDGKSVVYRDCDFSYAILVRGYFHNAKFQRCKFIGARCIATNFRSASFEACDFSYADFDRCVIPIQQLLANLPTFPNVRWELLRNLRANMRALGDTRNESDLVWQEIDTEMEHWRLISRRQSGYYQKYTGTERLLARLRYWRLLMERYVWGHGESLTRLGTATLVALVILGLMNAVGRVGDLNSVSIGSMLKLWLDGFLSMAALFVDLPSVKSQEVAASPITSTLAVMLRYASIGLAVPVLYKYIAKR